MQPAQVTSVQPKKMVSYSAGEEETAKSKYSKAGTTVKAYVMQGMS